MSDKSQWSITGCTEEIEMQHGEIFEEYCIFFTPGIFGYRCRAYDYRDIVTARPVIGKPVLVVGGKKPPWCKLKSVILQENTEKVSQEKEQTTP